MPASQPQRRQRASQQCSFRGENGRCRRNQVVGGLCGLHASAASSPDIHPLASIINDLLNGSPIESSTLEDIAARAVSSVVGRPVTAAELREQIKNGGIEIDWEEARVKASDAYSRVSSRVYPSRLSPEDRARRDAERQQQKQRDQQTRKKASDISKARRILGFTAKEPVTRQMVKDRQRELARKHHPDRGGNVSRMQDINWAVDILTGPG